MKPVEQSACIVAVTEPTILKEFSNYNERLSADEFIAYVARVSNPANQNNTDTADKLVGYLVRNKHWSPFEMVNVVMEINTTRDIARQILRHRSFSFQEFSQRYADPTQLGFVTREARLQDNKNRQNSIETDDELLARSWEMKQQQLIHESGLAYKWAIENGIAKEQARCVLMEGLTTSRLYMSGNLRSWITYVALREKNGTQKEHREIALFCKKELCHQFPTLRKALGDVETPWEI